MYKQKHARVQAKICIKSFDTCNDSQFKIHAVLLFVYCQLKKRKHKKKKQKNNETCCVYIAKENANNASRKLISIQLYPGKIINDHS